jgi:hypothetical protein
MKPKLKWEVSLNPSGWFVDVQFFNAGFTLFVQETQNGYGWEIEDDNYFDVVPLSDALPTIEAAELAAESALADAYEAGLRQLRPEQGAIPRALAEIRGGAISLTSSAREWT